MTESLISELYYGRVSPSETITLRGDSEYESLSRLQAVQSEKIMNILPREAREDYDKLQSVESAIQELYLKENFISGFKLGISLLSEALAGADALMLAKPLFKNSTIFGHFPSDGNGG